MASINDSTRRRRVTFSQLEALWEFLNNHKELATGYNKSAQARDHSRQLWLKVAEELNSYGEGAVKDWRGWSNYWVDYKAKLKKKIAAVRASHNRTGGGPPEICLNHLEEKFIGLLGDGFGSGLPNTQVNPFPITLSVPEVDAPLSAENEILAHIAVEESQPPQEEASTSEMPQQPASTPPQVNESRPTRRRRSRTNYMSVEMARRSLVEISRERLEISRERLQIHRNNSSTLQDIMNTLNRIANHLNVD